MVAPGNTNYLADKDAMFKAMSEKLKRGEQLNEHEKKILQLLKEDPEDPGGQKYDPRMARNAKYVSEEQRGGQQARRFAPFPQGRSPAAQDFGAPGGGGRVPGYNPVGAGGRGLNRGGLPGGRELNREGLPGGRELNREGLPGGMESRRSPGEKQQLPELAEQEEVKELQVEDQQEQQAGGGAVGVARGGREMKRGGGGGEEDQGMDEQAFNPEDNKAGKEEEEGRDYGVDGIHEKPVENLNLPVPGEGGQLELPNPHRVVVDVDEIDFGREAKIRSPPKFENPDRAFDNQDQTNEQEELEQEQEEEEDGRNNDQLGHRQFEEDMRMNREERMRMRAIPRGQKVWNGDQQGGMEQGQKMEWNADRQGGMEQGHQEGVDDAMMQEMHVNDMRRKEVADQLEAEEQQRRLNQPHIGQRDNLR